MLLPCTIGKGLPIRDEWLHPATKNWIFTIFASNLHASKSINMPILPHEMWFIILKLVVQPTFKQYGLCPVKTLSGWYEQASIGTQGIPRQLYLAGSSVLHHESWRGWSAEDWDIYGNFNDLIWFSKWIMNQLKTDPSATFLKHVHQQRNTETYMDSVDIQIFNDDQTEGSMKYNDGTFNLNFITTTRFDTFDVYEAGYHFDLAKRCWYTPTDVGIDAPLNICEWNFYRIAGEVALQAVDELMSGTTCYGPAFYRRRAFIVAQYFSKAKHRAGKYRNRAKGCGIPMTLHYVEDLSRAKKMLHFFTKIYLSKPDPYEE